MSDGLMKGGGGGGGGVRGRLIRRMPGGCREYIRGDMSEETSGRGERSVKSCHIII